MIKIPVSNYLSFNVNGYSFQKIPLHQVLIFMPLVKYFAIIGSENNLIPIALNQPHLKQVGRKH
jgi:ACR3 family arsenite efflux pump ArsB